MRASATALLTLLSLSFAAPVAAQKKDHAEGSRASISVKNKPLEQVLAQLEKKTQNRVIAVDDFPRSHIEGFEQPAFRPALRAVGDELT